MAEHKIKIKRKYYLAVQSGEKTFEIRKNDRDYQVGDIIHFVPIDDENGLIIPHNPNSYRITYVFHGGEYGLANGYCVFGIVSDETNTKIRNKAIEEFSEAIKTFPKIYEWCCYDLPMKICGGTHCEVCVEHFKNEIDEIAESMKGEK